jgi:hypothetical protein
VGIDVSEEQSTFVFKTEAGNLRRGPAWSVKGRLARPVQAGDGVEEMSPLKGLCDAALSQTTEAKTKTCVPNYCWSVLSNVLHVTIPRGRSSVYFAKYLPTFLRRTLYQSPFLMLVTLYHKQTTVFWLSSLKSTKLHIWVLTCSDPVFINSSNWYGCCVNLSPIEILS